MTDKFNPGRLGDWVLFCDICGGKCWASEATKLSTYTGRGGLIVCPEDRDKIDYGTIPYELPKEKPVPYTRINHTDTTNAAEPIEIDDMPT